MIKCVCLPLCGCAFCFCYISGPQMPKKLYGSSAVQIGGDLYLIGGVSNDKSDYQTAIHRMSCSARVCTWTTMTQKLKVGRQASVAIPIPKSFCVPIEQ